MIREATLSDIPRVRTLSQALFLDPSSASDTYANTEWPMTDSGKTAFEGAVQDGFLWVLEVESEIEGFICADVSEPVEWRPIKRVELLSFYITPKHRSGGYGTQLVAELVGWAKVQGAQTIFVSAYTDNVGGIEFYKKMGFHDYSVELEMDLQ